MTITIGSWIIPVLLTVVVWTPVVMKLRGLSKYGGYAGIGAALEGVFFLGLGVIGTLIIWMVYFAILYFIGG